MSRLRRAWLSIREPRVLKVTYFGIYNLVLAIGIVTMVNPPRSIEGSLGGLLTSVWAGLLILSGVIGVLAALPGWWALERLGIIAGFAGLGIYSSVAFTLHFTQEGQRITQALVILLAACVLLVRLVLIRRGEFEPRR